MNHTAHSRKRSQQRGLTDDVIFTIMALGTRTRSARKAIKLQLGASDYRNRVAELKYELQILEKAKGRTLVIDPATDQIITAY